MDGKDNKILEAGCGFGRTGALLKKHGKAAEVIGIELNTEAARHAQEQIDHVIPGNLETMSFPFHEEEFDYIIAGDILEHLLDPWSVLAQLRQFLKPSGFLVASIPNVRNWRVLVDLIFRDAWTYADEGLLDRTHLRFFTRTTIEQMFRHSGYDVASVCPAFCYDSKSSSKKFNVISGGVFERFITRQYLINASRGK